MFAYIPIMLLLLLAIALIITIKWWYSPVSSYELTKPPSLPKQSNRTLRPKRLEDFVGHTQAKSVVQAMTHQGSLSDHLLFVGPPGVGKTTLARIAAGSVELYTIIGGHLKTVADAEQAMGGDMLFVDEIHAANRKALEVFYHEMESGNAWKLLASTTDSGRVPSPLRDRFGATIYLSYYNDQDMEAILTQSASWLGVILTEHQRYDIIRRARGTPRIANSLLRRAIDFGLPTNLQPIWEALDIDEQGLNSLDRQVLEILRNSDRPMGLDQLALRTGVDTKTISSSIEPYLLRRGLIDIQNSGRIAI